MATNTFRPTALRTGVSTSVITPTPDGGSAQNQQTVYEWMDYSSQWKTNPPFLKGSAGSLMEGLRVSGGEERPRILRGFIRRAQYALNDDASMSRLYFMYNPETISRDYMNYLDQGALDPFNTVFQSGNLVAPPSMLNFGFELFFDRQEEAMAANNRGVMVDMDYFDLVVRNVKPGGSSANNTLPDNGIMMVNPRDITVVFSPEITVQGRPLNASVTYERFTHKMVPTRMRINLQMRVVYFGPQKEITTFVPETVRALEAVTFLPAPVPYVFDYSKPLRFEGNNESYGSNTESEDGDDGEADPDATTNVAIAEEMQDQPIPSGNEEGFIRLNREAASHGWKRAHETQDEFSIPGVGSGFTTTQYAGENGRMRIWKGVDCSSFVWACYAELGLSTSLTWEPWKDDDGHDEPDPTGDIDKQGTNGWANNTGNMIDKFASNDSIGRKLAGWGGEDLTVAKIIEVGTAGDLVYRKKTSSKAGHVAFVWTIDKAAQSIELMHAGSESMDIDTTTHSGSLTYDYLVRPHPRSS